ncbi:MAG: amidohydrolase [Ruminococcaceae bacterium]|nr:amidohydrolase [Oscillospiraceae bacterium]
MNNDMLLLSDSIKDDLVRYRRTIHKNPECGKQLPKTRAYVKGLLREFGYDPVDLCESSVIADISGGSSKKAVLLRADMDALPIRERAEIDFKSENGNMHACGHDMHTAILLGAARLLMLMRDRLSGTVRLVFQQDEEGLTGARSLIDAGVLDGLDIGAALALHIHSGTPTDTIMCGSGTCMAGPVFFRITVHGTGCHGAMPETGVDPIYIAAQIYSSIQEILAREICAVQPALITVGKFLGGDAANVIPDRVVMEGSVRTMDSELSAHIFSRIRDISISTAQMLRGSAEVVSTASVPPLTNDPILTEKVVSYIEELTNRPVTLFDSKGMGSDDFSFFTDAVPGVYLLLGAGTREENPLFGKPTHNEQVVFNEAVLPTGSAILAHCAMQWLRDHT